MLSDDYYELSQTACPPFSPRPAALEKLLNSDSHRPTAQPSWECPQLTHAPWSAFPLRLVPQSKPAHCAHASSLVTYRSGVASCRRRIGSAVFPSRSLPDAVGVICSVHSSFFRGQSYRRDADAQDICVARFSGCQSSRRGR